jgi:hypothetical protein
MKLPFQKYTITSPGGRPNTETTPSDLGKKEVRFHASFQLGLFAYLSGFQLFALMHLHSEKTRPSALLRIPPLLLE